MADGESNLENVKDNFAVGTAPTVDEDMDNVVTLSDVIEAEDMIYDDARAVLGAANPDCCTYSEGYLKRQPLYACATCATDSGAPGGTCYACSLHCHDGHDMIELYTKRNFRCDCGNSKFAGFRCSLIQNKEADNDENVYSHNFQGKYCTCGRPYPDPDESDDDEMFQCVICEDWFHERHLETGAFTKPVDFGEVACSICVGNHTFLRSYCLDLTLCDAVSVEPSATAAVPPHVADDSTNILKQVNGCVSDSADGVMELDKEPNLDVIPKNRCKLIETTTDVTTSMPNKACFFPECWRDQLCQCDKCMLMYKEQKVMFLLDPEDTIAYYEKQADAGQASSGASFMDDAMGAFQSQFEPQRQVEMLHEYNNMRDEIKDYLREFAENNKVVRKEDIAEFFERMKSRKRQQVDIPDFCR